MKKLLFYIPVIFMIMTGCSSVDIQKTKSETNEVLLKEKLGNWYAFRISPVNQYYFNKMINSLKDSVMQNTTIPNAEKESRIKSYDNIKYVENQYFSFNISHLKMFPRSKGDIVLDIKDATGGNAGSIVSETISKISSSQSGSWYVTSFYFMTIRPLTEKTFTRNLLPLSVSCQFLETQKLEYTLAP